MAFVLDPTKSVADEVRRVTTERLDQAVALLEQLANAEPDAIESAVHDVRKRCKEVRAIARLVRASIGDEYDRCNRAVREAANVLAPIRDAHAVLATFDELRATGDQPGDPDLERIRSGLARLADEATRSVRGDDPRIGQAHDLLLAARVRVGRWPVGDDFASVAAGLATTYERGRTALHDARSEPSDERLHEWRKSVKHLWYHTRLLEPNAPSVLSPLVATLDHLSEALGDDHDLAVLRDRLAADPDRFGGRWAVARARRLARGQQRDLRRRAFRLGATVYAERPKAFVRRMTAYRERTVRDGPELPTGGIAALAEAQHDAAAGRRGATAGTGPAPDLGVSSLPDLPDRAG